MTLPAEANVKQGKQDIGDMDVAEKLADKWSDLHTSKRIQNELDPTLSEDPQFF